MITTREPTSNRYLLTNLFMTTSSYWATCHDEGSSTCQYLGFAAKRFGSSIYHQCSTPTPTHTILSTS